MDSTDGESRELVIRSPVDMASMRRRFGGDRPPQLTMVASKRGAPGSAWGGEAR